jgi:hypothetical protein
VKAAQRSPDELFEETIGFAIMAGNIDLLSELVEQIWEEKSELNLSRTFPFHLATSYLRGGKSCCNVIEILVAALLGVNTIRKLYANDHGHTVLDNFMLAILKAHTSCPPVTVDDVFRKDRRFPGEEVDICGRWDADSPCIRKLLADGNPVIPFEWKHMFCHTSAQTLCHSIGTIFGPKNAPNINTPSGLFLKLCSHCGRRLQLQPLHCLVLTAFHLARSGCEGENLFGILACLVCLLVNGADPLLKAHVSLKALLGTDEGDQCSHSEIDPSELAGQVPDTYMLMWTGEVKLGWRVFCRVLQFAQEERRPKKCTSLQRGNEYEFNEFIGHNGDSEDGDQETVMRDTDEEDEEDDGDDEYDEEEEEEEDDDDEDDEDEYASLCYHSKEHENSYSGSTDIGTLWAAIQTELLTYRRISDGDPWLSPNFSMHSLLDGLKIGSGISSLPLVEQKMMKPFCRCGRFNNVNDEACVRVEEACAYYFSNLEDWKRSTFIDAHIYRIEMWY